MKKQKALAVCAGVAGTAILFVSMWVLTAALTHVLVTRGDVQGTTLAVIRMTSSLWVVATIPVGISTWLLLVALRLAKRKS